MNLQAHYLEIRLLKLYVHLYKSLMHLYYVHLLTAIPSFSKVRFQM